MCGLGGVMGGEDMRRGHAGCVVGEVGSEVGRLCGVVGGLEW